MPKCLGIYIEDNIIKYAKVEKNKDDLKVDSSNVIFFEKNNLKEALESVIRESYSSNDLISINISNDMYNFYDVFAELKPSDIEDSVDLEFELMCGDKGYSKESLETRFFGVDSRQNKDEKKIIHIATNKEKLKNLISEFGNVKVGFATPISTSIPNLLKLTPKDNAVIVNIENTTKITTILEGEIYHIDALSTGMGNILENIDKKENSLKKAYDCCKNTTIYTSESQLLQIEENDYLEDIMPELYKIMTEVKEIVSVSLKPIEKVYITGLATAINNIDLYFQEHIPNVKCELLKPYIVETSTIKKPIKDYIEVNSAISLALYGLGYGDSKLNFKGKSTKIKSNFDLKSLSQKLFGEKFLSFGTPLTGADKLFVRLIVCLIVGIGAYALLGNSILDQIDDKRKDIKKSDEEVTSQIAIIESQIETVDEGENDYRALITSISSMSNEDETLQNEIVIKKDAIPNLLNRIIYVIPTKVKIVSIENTTGDHIVIEAQANKHEQLGFFKAALDVNGILTNVKSSSGIKVGDTITITIEGDLP